MEVTVSIADCTKCRHISHSGAFTPGGAKAVCDHPDAVETFTALKKVNPKQKDEKFHCRHRVIKDMKKIPGNCPLKSGSHY